MSEKYTQEMHEQYRQEQDEQAARGKRDRAERMAKDAARQKWVAEGGSETAFEKSWPEIRTQQLRDRVQDTDQRARDAQRSTGVSRI